MHKASLAFAAFGHSSRLFGAMLLLGSLVIFASTVTWALSAPGVEYVWPLSMISDLGASDCFTADGRWICSPRATAFNVGLLAAGTALGCAVTILRRRWGLALCGSVASAAIGLILLGLLPSDTAPRAHMVGAVLALPVASALLMISGIRGERLPGPDESTETASQGPSIVPTIRTVLATVALLSTVLHLFPDLRVRGAAEAVALGSLYLALLQETCVLLRSGRRSDRGPAKSAVKLPDGESSATPHPTRQSGCGTAASGSPRRRKDRSAIE